jgi:hypothetical protein
MIFIATVPSASWKKPPGCLGKVISRIGGRARACSGAGATQALGAGVGGETATSRQPQSGEPSFRGSTNRRTLGWAEEHEKCEPLGDVVEGMMHPSRDENDRAGTDIEAAAISI